jgi:hypothetical protein
MSLGIHTLSSITVEAFCLRFQHHHNLALWNHAVIDFWMRSLVPRDDRRVGE